MTSFDIRCCRRVPAMRRACMISSASVIAAAAVIAPSSAMAQTTGGPNNAQLEDIVVVAQKRSENSQKVPIAITIVGATQLSTTGALSANTLNTAVPGLTINQTAAYFSPRIRGIGTTAFGPGIENPVALYIDDVYYASQVAVPTDLSDVNQLAVLKGPQGTLFGRNATGGVMQMSTRNPEKDFKGEVSTQLDQYLTSRNFFYVTGGSDTVQANLAASYATQGEGWGRNLVTGNDIKKINNDVGLRGKIFFTPSESTEIKLIGDYFKRRNSMGPNNRPIPGGGYGLPGGLATSTSLLIDGGSTSLPPGVASHNDYDSTSVLDPINRIKGGGVSLHISQDVGFARLVSITAYRDYWYQTYFDTGGMPYVTLDTGFVQKGRQFSQELQLVSKDSKPLSWVVGAFYFNGKDRLNGSIQRSWNFFQPTSANGLALPIGTQNQTQDMHVSYGTESLAGFAQATYEFLPETHVTGGIRYTWEKRTRSGYVDILTDGVFAPVPGGVDGHLSVAQPGDSISAKRFTWRLALDHDFAPSILGYASWNRGFKSGGYNGISVALTNDLPEGNPYKPEKLDAYEIGLKSELFDRTLRLNPAIFYYKYSQIQVTKFTASSTTIVNGAKADLYGMNLDAVWQPTRSLTFDGGFEWLWKAKFKSFPNAPSNVPVPLDANPANIPGFGFPGGVYSSTTDAAGNRIPYAAKFSATIGMTYKTELAGATVSFNVNDAYNSGYPTEVDNRLRQGSTNITSASIMWLSPDDRLEISVFAHNLLDDRINALLVSQAPVGDVVDYGNPPRTYGFSAKYKFGAK